MIAAWGGLRCPLCGGNAFKGLHRDWCRYGRGPDNNQTAGGELRAEASNDRGYPLAEWCGNQSLEPGRVTRAEGLPAFEVQRVPVSGQLGLGHSWRIYADGRVAGFNRGEDQKDGLVVINRIPQLLAEARAHQERLVFDEIKRQQPAGVFGVARHQSDRFWSGYFAGMVTLPLLALFLLLLGFR